MKKKITKDSVFAFIRHTLTFVGGVLIVSGKGDAELVGQAGGAVVTAIGLVWSLIEKMTRPPMTPDANTDAVR